MSVETFYRTVGFLANRARFEAFVILSGKQSFEKRYYEATGIRPVDGSDGYFLHSKDVNKWGPELRLSFLATPDEKELLDFSQVIPKVTIVGSPRIGEYRINSNKLVWWFWEHGFKNGVSQDIVKIRSLVPQEYKKYFDEGIEEIVGSDFKLQEKGREYSERLERLGKAGEGIDHLQLKQYVAHNGAKLGLFVWENGEQEFLFVSGDRCDVVFDLRESGMAVVEVKNGEVGELVKGIYQAIKYRALMTAEKGHGEHFNVEAILVAYEIPIEIQEYALRFGIKCKVFPKAQVKRWHDT